MRLLRFAAIFVALLLGTIALGNMAERWILYPFDATYAEPPAPLEEIRFDNEGETLLAWAAAPRAGKPLILYFHGNAGNLAIREGRFRRFLDQGYGLFAPAYRGASGSSGIPSEAALTWDAEVAFHTLFKTFPDLPAKRVVIYGESLGTAVALSLFESPALHQGKGFGPPAGIILEAPFTSIQDLAEHHYPGTGALAEKLDSQWPSLTRAARVSVPLLVIHGTEDSLIPIEMGRQIHAAAPSGKSSFLAVTGAGHTDLWRSDTLPRLWRFMDQFALR